MKKQFLTSLLVLFFTCDGNATDDKDLAGADNKGTVTLSSVKEEVEVKAENATPTIATEKLDQKPSAKTKDPLVLVYSVYHNRRKIYLASRNLVEPFTSVSLLSKGIQLCGGSLDTVDIQETALAMIQDAIKNSQKIQVTNIAGTGLAYIF